MVKRALCLCLVLAACSKPRDVAVTVVNPCDQDALGKVDFLKFEPRGTNIDSMGLTTIQMVSDMGSAPIKIPLVDDFMLVVTGHKDAFDAPPTAIGVSADYDLTKRVDGPVTVSTMLDLVDTFHKTTDLSDAATCSKPEVARFGHTATLLASNKVLIVGGEKISGTTLEYPLVIEVYDPATGVFARVADLDPGLARAYHTATLLSDGKVLIAGGERVNNMGVRDSLKSAFVIDPGTDASSVSFSQPIAMKQQRSGHTAVLVDDGKAVLLAGGRTYVAAASRPEDHTYLSTIEIFDPQGLFYFPNDGSGTTVEMKAKRYAHSATVLKSGRDVVIGGGFNENGPERDLEVLHAEKCDQHGGCKITRSSTSAAVTFGAIAHAAALAPTPDGRTVMFSGGYSSIADAEPMGTVEMNSSRVVEMWQLNEAGTTFIRTCNGLMDVERARHMLALVGDRALFAGGFQADGKAPASGAVAVVSPSNGNCFHDPPTAKPMSAGRADATATVLGTGEILIVGGKTERTTPAPFGTPVDISELFSPARLP